MFVREARGVGFIIGGSEGGCNANCDNRSHRESSLISQRETSFYLPLRSDTTAFTVRGLGSRNVEGVNCIPQLFGHLR